MDYYQKTQFLAAVNKADTITGQVEKWEAHKEAILHRGYTAVLECNGIILLQHRHHPVFDDVLDLSFSSHPVYEGGRLQTDGEAIALGLDREWGVKPDDLKKEPVLLGKVYYRALDKKSGYSEHEVDSIYLVSLNRLPRANPDFAYGQREIEQVSLASRLGTLDRPLAPWVSVFLREKVL